MIVDAVSLTAEGGDLIYIYMALALGWVLMMIFWGHWGD